MDKVSRRYIWIFFGVLMAVMIGAYILNTLYAPLLKKPPNYQPGITEPTSYYYELNLS